MLLAVDIGNSTISTGLFGLDGELRFLASLDTDYRKTADQLCVDPMNLFQLYHFRYEDVTDSILCSVVPPLNFMMEKALTRLLGKPPVVVGPGVKTGLNIRLAVQSQVGADIVADAVSALEQFTAPIITIDMGTATTSGVISEGRTYEGGLLLPGVNVSLEALSRRAAQLPAISLQAPKNLIGKSTEDCMRSGIVYGTAAMLDGIIDRIRGEFPGKELHIVATGGSATPQPTHWVKSTWAFPSFMEMAGQPIFMQFLQPTHLSVSTARGALCLTYFSRAQGRREMMTEGSSAESSSFTAWSQAFRS